MTKLTAELKALLDAEAEAAEATKDEPMVGGRRRGTARSVVYSVRLTPDEVEAINKIADAADCPASQLVRDWVIAGLKAEPRRGEPDLAERIGALEAAFLKFAADLGRGDTNAEPLKTARGYAAKKAPARRTASIKKTRPNILEPKVRSKA